MPHEPNPQTKHTVKALYGVLTAGLQLSLAVLTYILTSEIKGATSFPLFFFSFLIKKPVFYISPWLALIRRTDIGLDVLDENEGFLDAMNFRFRVIPLI